MKLSVTNELFLITLQEEEQHLLATDNPALLDFLEALNALKRIYPVPRDKIIIETEE